MRKVFNSILVALTVVGLALAAPHQAHAAFSSFQAANNPANPLPQPDGTCALDTGIYTGVGGTSTCIVGANVAQCTGVSNDSQAFLDFNSWATGTWQVAHPGLVLGGSLPSGANCRIDVATTCGFGGSASCPFINIKKLIFSGAGEAVTSITAFNGNILFFAGDSFDQRGGVVSHCALIDDASSGATQVTTLTAGEASVVTVGQWASVMGFDMQGEFNSGFGFPPNPGFHNFVQITSTNTGTGVVQFTQPLTADYLKNWPSFGTDPGPAAICPLASSWDADVEFRDFTFTQADSGPTPIVGTKAEGHKVTWRNVTFTGNNGPYGTVDGQINFIDVTCPTCLIESDKMIDEVNYTGGTFDTVLNQSSSIKLTTMDGTVLNTKLDGTTKAFVGTNLTIPLLKIGSPAFGRATSFSCTNCVIADMPAAGVNEKGPGDVGVNNVYTMSGGVISVPKGSVISNMQSNLAGGTRVTVSSTATFTTGKDLRITCQNCGVNGGIYVGSGQVRQITVINGTQFDISDAFSGTFINSGTASVGNPSRWAVPGANVFLVGSEPYETSFYVTGVTESGGNILVATNLAGGFPAVNTDSGKLYLTVHPAPAFTCTNCTGAGVSVYAGATPGAPLYSYAQATCTGSTNFPFGGDGSCFWPFTVGNLVSVTVAVNTAYTGTANPLSFDLFNGLVTYKSDYSTYTWNSAFNARTSGTRTVTGLACTNCQAGDAAYTGGGAAPGEAVYLSGASGLGAWFTTNIKPEGAGVWPSIVITVQTDQHLH